MCYDASDFYVEMKVKKKSVERKITVYELKKG